MRQFLDQMAAAGERAAPRLWLGFIGLFWLALCLDAVWWRGLPRFVSWIAPAYLILTIGGWAKVAPALREQDRSPVFWLFALPFIAVGGLTWITTWYLEYPGMASPSYTLLWASFSFGLAVVLLAAITHRWFRRQLPWSDHTFWGIACLGLLPLWVWLLFVDSFFGWELHGYIARIGLLAIFLSGLAWTIGLVDIQSRRVQARRLQEDPPVPFDASPHSFRRVFPLALFLGAFGVDRFTAGCSRWGWGKLAAGIVLPAALIAALATNRYFLLDEVKPDYLRRLAKAQVKSRGWENAVQTPKPGDTARRVAIAQALPEIQDVENQELPFLEKARKAALTVLAHDMFGEAWAAAIRFGPTLAYLEGKGAGHRAGLVNALIDEDEAKKFFQTHRKNPRLTRLKNLSEEDNLALYLVLEDMKWSTAKVRFYKQMAAASVWGGAGLGILPEVVLEMPGRIVAAAWKGNQWALAILAGALLYIVWLIDLILLLLGRYRDGKGRFVHVAPWKSSALKRMGPLEAMNISLTEGRRHIANPFDLDAWYYGRTHQKLKQSLNTTVSYTALFILIAVLLLLLPGCRDIYEMPAGGGDPQLKRKVVKVQKVKKKVYVVNPFSAILFNPDIERIQLKLEELTKHLYQVGQGKGKGAGFAGGTRRGIVRFIRLRYSSGDWDQDVDLDADLNMLTWYAAQTGHKTAKKPEVRTIRQLGAFPVGKSPPVVYITGQRSLSISRAERETLREYLTTKHGMLFADNGGSSTWHSQFFSLMRQVLPRTDPRPVPLDHPVHDGLPFLPIVAPHGGHTAYMWVVENRIVAYYHPGDIGDAWANGHAGVSRPVWEACYRLGGNVFLYAHSEYSKWLQSRKKKD